MKLVCNAKTALLTVDETPGITVNSGVDKAMSTISQPGALYLIKLEIEFNEILGILANPNDLKCGWGVIFSNISLFNGDPAISI